MSDSAEQSGYVMVAVSCERTEEQNKMFVYSKSIHQGAPRVRSLKCDYLVNEAETSN